MVAHPIDGGEGPHRRRALSQLSRGVTRCSRASGAPLPEGVGGQRLLTRRLWSGGPSPGRGEEAPHAL